MAQRKGEEAVGYQREDDPPYLYPDYVATRPRAPKKPLIILPRTLSDTTGPRGTVGELDDDLTRQHSGEPLGERIIVKGRVLDGDGRPVRNSLVEIWQANRAGRYNHPADNREDQELRRTLIARDEGDVLRFDIHLQGEGQTVFFEF